MNFKLFELLHLRIDKAINMRLFKPEVFQGNLKQKNYFEGWYFKNVSNDLRHVWSFIPGVSITEKDPHAFIQAIDGITGKSEYFRYPLIDFFWEKDCLNIKIGNSVFTETYIDLKIENENFSFSGHLSFSNIVKYPGSIFSPGIMGWYSFVPFMECKHGIVSVNHNLSGSLMVNNDKVDFNGGKGYIEKDWGTSFPEAWLWIQCNNFTNPDTSFTFSVAKIPWLGKFFVGFIAFLYFNNRFFLFSTYGNSAITELNHSGQLISLTLKNKNHILKVNASKNSFGELRAPQSGDMSRRIKESIDSDVSISLYDKHENLIYNDTGTRAGLEVIEEIFGYVKH
jgi:tocopherol cyclase